MLRGSSTAFGVVVSGTYPTFFPSTKVLYIRLRPAIAVGSLGLKENSPKYSGSVQLINGLIQRRLRPLADLVTAK